MRPGVACLLNLLHWMKTKGGSLSVLSAIERSIVVKAAFFCLGHALIFAIARVNGDPKYELYTHGRCLQKPVEDLLNGSGADLSNGGGVVETSAVPSVPFGLQNSCLMDLDLIGSFSVEISSRPRNCTCFMTRTLSTMSLQTLKRPWLRSIYVTDVTPYMTKHTNVTKPAPCVVLHHPVLRIRQSIVLHAIGTFSVRNVSRII